VITGRELAAVAQETKRAMVVEQEGKNKNRTMLANEKCVA